MDEVIVKSTLYPKISGKLLDLTYAISKFYAQHPDIQTPEQVEFTGTVKLHGTHADILVYENGDIVCQSRNRLKLTPEDDNVGFAAFVAGKKSHVRALAEAVKARWRSLHPGKTLPVSEPITLAGEWIGRGIMKGVAIAQLSRRFVLYSVYMASIWQPIELYADLAEESAGLLNIGLGGFYRQQFDIRDEGEAFLVEAKRLTLQAAKECPFGLALGVEGPGEGIVWTPASNASLPNLPDFWLKTKGEAFFVTAYEPRPPSIPNTAYVDGLERSKMFAKATATPARLEQGWHYLAEMKIEQNRKATGAFLKWLTEDIETEERREIETDGVHNSWRRQVTRIGAEWYSNKLVEEGVETAAV